MDNLLHIYTVKPVYCGHLGTTLKCADYQGVLILYDIAALRASAVKRVNYAGVLILSVHINRFHCIATNLTCKLMFTIYKMGVMQYR